MRILISVSYSELQALFPPSFRWMAGGGFWMHNSLIQLMLKRARKIRALMKADSAVGGWQRASRTFQAIVAHTRCWLASQRCHWSSWNLNRTRPTKHCENLRPSEKLPDFSASSTVCFAAFYFVTSWTGRWFKWEWIVLPPECGGGPHSRTTPWPSRTDTELLLWVLKLSKSEKERKRRAAS